MNSILKIAVVGVESTGKSDMCKYLATYYNTLFVPEFARDYLAKTNGIYEEHDLKIIATGQLNQIKSALLYANEKIFLDTDMLVLQVWSEVKYNSCDKLILDTIANNDIDFYLLMDIDLTWQFDVLRENPDRKDRKKLMLHYKEILQNINIPFAIISGLGEDRNGNAILAIENYLSKK